MSVEERMLMILLCNNDLCQFSGRCPIPSQNICFCGIFRVKIRVCQLIPSQEKIGVVIGVFVRVVVLMFTGCVIKSENKKRESP